MMPEIKGELKSLKRRSFPWFEVGQEPITEDTVCPSGPWFCQQSAILINRQWSLATHLGSWILSFARALIRGTCRGCGDGTRIACEIIPWRRRSSAPVSFGASATSLLRPSLTPRPRGAIIFRWIMNRSRKLSWVPYDYGWSHLVCSYVSYVSDNLREMVLCIHVFRHVSSLLCV